MSFSKTLSSSILAALIFAASGSPSAGAQQTGSPIAAGKDKILAASAPSAASADKDKDKDKDNQGSNNPGKCQSKTNPKCNPVSPSN
jgi:hypothetical protein